MSAGRLSRSSASTVQGHLKDFVLVNYDWFEETSKVLFKVIDDAKKLHLEVARDVKHLSTSGKQMLAYVIGLQPGMWIPVAVFRDGDGTNLSAYIVGDENKIGIIKLDLLNAGVGEVVCRFSQFITLDDSDDPIIVAAESLNLMRIGRLNPAFATKQHKPMASTFWNSMSIKTEIREKFTKCLWSLITERQPNSGFRYADANLFVLFLDAVAMQINNIPKNIQKNYINKIGTCIIGDESWSSIKKIRSEYLLQRMFPHTFTLAEIENIIVSSCGNVVDFFNDAKLILEQIIEHLDILHATGEFTNGISKFISLRCKIECQSREKHCGILRKLFLTIISHAYDEDLGQIADELLFEFTVNLVPVLLNFIQVYNESAARSAQDIDEIRRLQGKVLYGQYEDPATRAQSILSATFRCRAIFSRIYYARELFNVFLKMNEESLDWKEVMDSKLFETTLRGVHQHFARHYCSKETFVNADHKFGYSDHEWVHIEVHELQEYFELNYRLLFVLEQTELTAKHKRKVLELCETWKVESQFPRPHAYEKEFVIREIKRCKMPILIEDAILTEFIEFKPPTMVVLGRETETKKYITNALVNIQNVIQDHKIGNADLIEKFGNRFKEDRNDPVTQRLRQSRTPDPMYITLNGEPRPFAIEPDSIVVNLVEMCNEPFIRYKIQFMSLESVFMDEAVLSYMVDEFQKHEATDLGHVLLSGPNFLNPLIVKLIVIAPQFHLSLGLCFMDLMEMVRELFRNELHMKFLVELLEIPNEILESAIYSPEEAGVDHNSVQSYIIGVICMELYNPMLYSAMDELYYPSTMPLLFEQHLLECIRTLFDPFNQFDSHEETKRIILRNIMNTVNIVCFKEYKCEQEEKTMQSIQIMTEVLEMISSSKLLSVTELRILEARRILAKLLKQINSSKEALELCLDTHTKLQPLFVERPSAESLQDERLLQTYSKYLLNLSDIGHAYHLLKDHAEAYKWYNTLCNEILGNPVDSSDTRFSLDIYVKLQQSPVYQRLATLSNKYLNILRILTDMMYVKNQMAQNQQQVEQQDCQQVLAVYSIVYKIRLSELGPEHPDTTASLRGLQYTEFRIGNLCKNSGEFEKASAYLQRSFEKIESLVEIQAKRFGAFHPLVVKAKESRSKTQFQLAAAQKKAGEYLQRRNPNEALQHFQSALENYRQSYEHQIVAMGPDDGFAKATLSTIMGLENRVASFNSRNRSNYEWRVRD